MNVTSRYTPTCDQGLICHGASLNHFPVDGELSSWGDLHNVTPLYQLHHHLLLTEASQYIYNHIIVQLRLSWEHLLIIFLQDFSKF